MSLTTYESSIKTISYNEDAVFDVLSDWGNIEKIKDKLPQDKVKDMVFDADSVHFKIDGFGEMGFHIIQREPYKTIKIESENSPILVNMWIQLKQVAENDTRIKLTLKADFPSMIKMMLDKKLKDGIEQIADMLTNIPYSMMKN